MTNLERILIEKEHITCQQILDRALMESGRWIGNEPRVLVRETRALTYQMIYAIESYLVKQEPQIVQVGEFELTVSVPDTLSDWLKMKFSPPWLRERWSWARPRLRELRHRVRATTDVTVLYPHLKFAFPEEKRIVVKAGLIRWMEERYD